VGVAYRCLIVFVQREKEITFKIENQTELEINAVFVLKAKRPSHRKLSDRARIQSLKLKFRGLEEAKSKLLRL